MANTDKINIANILRYAPSDIYLYSEVSFSSETFIGVMNENGEEIIATIYNENEPHSYYSYGTILPNSSKVCLFPKKDLLWENSGSFRKIFEQNKCFGYVIIDKSGKNAYLIKSERQIIDNLGFVIYHAYINSNDYRFANPDETEKFFKNFKQAIPIKLDPIFKEGTYITSINKYFNKHIFYIKSVDIENNVYHVYDKDDMTTDLVIYFSIQDIYKEVEITDPIVLPVNPEKDVQDIEQSFKTGELVLCRNISDNKNINTVNHQEENWQNYWNLCIFSNTVLYSNQDIKYVASGNIWDLCIPYTDKTKELVGTDNDIKRNINNSNNY